MAKTVRATHSNSILLDLLQRVTDMSASQATISSDVKQLLLDRNEADRDRKESNARLEKLDRDVALVQQEVGRIVPIVNTLQTKAAIGDGAGHLGRWIVQTFMVLGSGLISAIATYLLAKPR